MIMFSGHELCFSAGKPTPKNKVNRPDCPESMFSFRIQFKPFHVFVFRQTDCILNIGYKPWLLKPLNAAS